jgi:hypothetical protein
MAKKRATSRCEGGPESKPWLPNPRSVIEVKEAQSPTAGAFRIIRTNIVDPYDEPLAAPKRPSRKRR